jgi:hypothetical protein
MASKSFPRNTLAQATELLAACKQIDPQMSIGLHTQAAFAEEIGQAQALRAQIHALELQLTDLRNQRDARLTSVWDTVKRGRAIVKGAYGDDSSAYELVGGTRMSERRRPARKAAA